MTNTSLLILGAGGHAKVVAETAIVSGLASNIAFLDDRFSQSLLTSPLLGWPVIGDLDCCSHSSTKSAFSMAVVAIGHAPTRLYWLQKLLSCGYEIPSLTHPSAWVSPSASIGPGSVIFSHVSVQAHADIKSGAILNTGCSVDHDVLLADGVHICPGARLAGQVNVGARSWLGIGSSVVEQVCIGTDVTVGAGATVIGDLPDGVTAVGVPAKPLLSH